jgi:hypothetical protein
MLITFSRLRVLAVATVLLVTTACASRQRGDHVYIRLIDRSIHSNPPAGLYIEARRVGQQYIPTSRHIRGEGPLCKQVTEWDKVIYLDVRTLELVTPKADPSDFADYITGCVHRDSGRFWPDDRTIRP